MRSYLLTLSYDGTGYFGWQSQPHGNTVQDTLETALAAVLGAKVRVAGASRTDTGVHATQQLALLRWDGDLDDGFPAAVQARLSAGIRIDGLRRVPDSFQPTREVASKRYCYRIRLCAPRDLRPFPRHWSIRRALDVDVLRSELATAIGTHDFTSFCAADSVAATKVRRVERIELLDLPDGLEIWLEAGGFLKQMIRILVGTAVARAMSVAGAPTVTEALAARDRTKAGRTAPAQGLTLEAISLKSTS